MVEEKKSVSGLAAMFEQNISQVKLEESKPMARRATTKLKANPFEQNVQAEPVKTAPPVRKAPVAVAKPVNTAASATTTAPVKKPVPAAQSTMPKPASTSAPMTQKPAPTASAPKPTSAAAPAEPKKPGKLGLSFFEQQIQAQQEAEAMQRKPSIRNPATVKKIGSGQQPALMKKETVDFKDPEEEVPKPAAKTNPPDINLLKSQSSIKVENPINMPNPSKVTGTTKKPVAAPTQAVASAPASTTGVNDAKQAANLRKKLTFVARERTPSPVEEKKQPAAAQGKLKMPLFEDDDEEEKKPKPVAPSQKATRPTPAAAAQSDVQDEDDPDDFKARLAAMLAGPAPSSVAKRPPAARQSEWQTAADIDRAKLEMPKVLRSRQATTKYDVSKYDFDGF